MAEHPRIYSLMWETSGSRSPGLWWLHGVIWDPAPWMSLIHRTGLHSQGHLMVVTARSCLAAGAPTIAFQTTGRRKGGRRGCLSFWGAFREVSHQHFHLCLFDPELCHLATARYKGSWGIEVSDGCLKPRWGAVANTEEGMDIGWEWAVSARILKSNSYLLLKKTASLTLRKLCNHRPWPRSWALDSSYYYFRAEDFKTVKSQPLERV